MEKDITALLREKGFKVTPQRLAKYFDKVEDDKFAVTLRIGHRFLISETSQAHKDLIYTIAHQHTQQSV